MFLVCVVFVVPNAPRGQDRTAEAQTFQRSSTSAGLAGQPSGAWILLLAVQSSVLVCVSQNAPPVLIWQGSRTVLGCY